MCPARQRDAGAAENHPVRHLQDLLGLRLNQPSWPWIAGIARGFWFVTQSLSNYGTISAPTRSNGDRVL